MFIAGITSANPAATRDYCFAKAGVEEAIWPFTGVQRVFDAELILRVDMCIEEVTQDTKRRALYSHYNDSMSDKAYRDNLGEIPRRFSKFNSNFAGSELFQTMSDQAGDSNNYGEHEALEGYNTVSSD